MSTIMLVDSQPLVRDGLASLLRECRDVTVVGTANNDAEGTARAASLQPEVIVVGISTPDGALQHIKALRQACPLAKLLVLASEDTSLFLTTMEAGARGYLLKTCKADELVTAIKMVASDHTVFAGRLAGAVSYSQPSYGGLAQSDPGWLSEREGRILQLVARGATNRDVARELSICETTVKVHLHNILDKLNAKNRAEAISRAASIGLLSLPLAEGITASRS